jgi:Domain of unknown function (DUF4145)
VVRCRRKSQQNIANDYIEACDVLPISAKASAALARRCLQNVLRAHGYTARDLASEIDSLLNESDVRKAIPSTLRMTVDAIRNFGNFSAHPITDVTSLQIIDVEPGEAEWCLEVLEALFDHFYVGPAVAGKKEGHFGRKTRGCRKASVQGLAQACLDIPAIDGDHRGGGFHGVH